MEISKEFAAISLFPPILGEIDNAKIGRRCVSFWIFNILGQRIVPINTFNASRWRKGNSRSRRESPSQTSWLYSGTLYIRNLNYNFRFELQV